MYYGKIFTILAFIFIFSLPSGVEANTTRIISGGDALAVSNLRIDQTAKNAVEAKDKAIKEAKAQALNSLAKRILDEDEWKRFQIPDEQTLNTLVRDFEIRNERLSSNRYIADFTVRFNDNTIDFIRGKRSFFRRLRDKEDPMQRLNRIDTTILVLPYYKNFYGKNELWEDPNPWRDAWQKLGGVRLSSTASIIIPMGDIQDISFGSSQEIWDASPRSIDSLKRKYNASHIIIPRAYKKGNNLEVDIFSLDMDNRFALQKSIISYLPSSSFQPAIDDIIYDKDFFASLTNDELKQEVKAPQTKVKLRISMFFNNFKEWMEVQKRLNSLEPKVPFRILSLNNSEVNFEINTESEMAHIDLKSKLRIHGLILTAPDYNFDGGYFNENMDEITYNYMLILRD